MRRLAPVTLAAAVAIALAGCGSADTPKGNSVSAPSETAQTLSLQQVSNVTTDALEDRGNVLMTLSGSAGGEQLDATVAVNLEGGQPSFEMVAEMPESDGGGEMRMVVLPDALYLNLGDEEVEPGKPWVQIDLGSDDPFSQVFAMMAEQLAGVADPAQQALTAQAGGTLESTTQEGDTTRYDISVDMEKAIQEVDFKAYLEALGDTATAALAAQDPELGDVEDVQSLSDEDAEKLRATLVSMFEGVTGTTVIWVGADGLPVKQTAEIDGDGPLAQSFTIEYSGWGSTTVAAPPADQVAQMPDLSGLDG